jgi:hypothetical protein
MGGASDFLLKGIPFAEVGMGVVPDDERLSALVHTMTRTADTRDSAVPQISLTECDVGANAYSTNIQIAN